MTPATYPTGNVVFSANGTPFATNGLSMLNSTSSVVTASTTALPAGTNSIVAQYLGDLDFQASVSASLAQVVTNWGAVAITNVVANVTNCAGTPAIFTVEASGNNLTYQWQVSGDGGTTFTNISASATNASYTNLVTTLAENGYLYQVIVSGSGGPTGTLWATSAPPAVLVVNAPATASAGGNQTICVGPKHGQPGRHSRGRRHGWHLVLFRHRHFLAGHDRAQRDLYSVRRRHLGRQRDADADLDGPGLRLARAATAQVVVTITTKVITITMLGVH